ncbi:MAG: molybdopterin molybdotransferase MoeA [Aestuariivita sp.]|nr:molybdopterin molybdotransferase MoeA [Aestuariivita sp.]MCY4346709.1 molybdopterin molybdotransferase MoeA [Aestuariivita sp.]
MIAVDDALNQLLKLARSLEIEFVPIANAVGRILAEDVTAKRNHPPFAMASMDGYAVNAQGRAQQKEFEVVGEAAAGHRFEHTIAPGQAVRIFTGAPVPSGTDFVVIQENVRRVGTKITLTERPKNSANIRPKAYDFNNEYCMTTPRKLCHRDIALLAAMGTNEVPVRRKAVIALISNGDELVMPGETPGRDQFFASNALGLKALFDEQGADTHVLPIARDNLISLREQFESSANADIILAIGGASVGDYDLVGTAANEMGLKRIFYKVAMRPGKPLMAGRLGSSLMIGLPGNPVSALVCGHVFVLPVLRKMQGLRGIQQTLESAILNTSLKENGPRAHYMRAVVKRGRATPFARQDSSLLTVFAQANALLVRPPHDRQRPSGDQINFLPI